jgi:hypothetical protein
MNTQPRRTLMVLVTAAVMAVSAGCVSAAGPGDPRMLPTASETARAFRIIGHHNVSCRDAGNGQMFCESRELGKRTSEAGHIDSGSTIGIYNFGRSGYSVKANRKGRDRIYYTAPQPNRKRQGWFYS